jgi:hypothetical protein
MSLVTQLAHVGAFACCIAGGFTGYVATTFPRQPVKAAVSFLGAMGWFGAGVLLALA